MWLHKKPKLNTLIEQYLGTQRLSSNTVKLTRHAWKLMVEQAGNIKVHKFNRDAAEKVQGKWLREKTSTTSRIYRKSVSPVFSLSLIHI